MLTKTRSMVVLIAAFVLFASILACGASSGVQPANSKPQITIISAVQGKDSGGHTQVVFQVRNDGTTQARFVKLRADCYNNGVVSATAWNYSSPETLEPGQTGSNRIWFDPGVTCDKIETYLASR